MGRSAGHVSTGARQVGKDKRVAQRLDGGHGGMDLPQGLLHGQKYKKCCLPLHQESSAQQQSAGPFTLVPGFTELDRLSNRVVDLIEEGRLDEAEAVCHELLSRYPDQIDGTERLAEVYEDRGEKKRPRNTIARRPNLHRHLPGLIRNSLIGTSRSQSI